MECERGSVAGVHESGTVSPGERSSRPPPPVSRLPRPTLDLFLSLSLVILDSDPGDNLYCVVVLAGISVDQSENEKQALFS
jgi:hypothetical protein